MRREDLVRLRHMIDAGDQAIAFAQGRAFEDFKSDIQFQYAVIHAVQIVLEAASQISPTTREDAPAVPWAKMIGMRNRVVHVYFDVDLQTVWSTIQLDFPPLLDSLRRLQDG